MYHGYTGEKELKSAERRPISADRMGEISGSPAVHSTAQRGLPVHCRRVRALAVDLARRVGATVQEQKLLADAALVHHYPAELLSSDTIGATLAIMQRQCRLDAQPLDAESRKRHLQELLQLLTSFHSISLAIGGIPCPAY